MKKIAWKLRPVSMIKRLLKYGLLVLLLIAGLFFVLWSIEGIPEWQVRRASVRSADRNPKVQSTPERIAEIENEFRRTDIEVIGGIGAFIALCFTFARLKVADQVHITDRYSKAIEQLGATTDGKPNVYVRLGGIYALERIARDSSRDHWTIMEILTAYIRGEVPTSPKSSDINLRNDIQTVLTILGRRRRNSDRESETQFLDLSQSNLSGANLNHSHWEEASFQLSNMQNADFSSSFMRGVDLQSSNIQEAAFSDTSLQDAILSGAHANSVDFHRANLANASLRFAVLQKADFTNACIQGADFTGAKGLNAVQIRKAREWRKAVFDEEFSKELIKVCIAEDTNTNT